MSEQMDWDWHDQMVSELNKQRRRIAALEAQLAETRAERDELRTVCEAALDFMTYQVDWTDDELPQPICDRLEAAIRKARQ